MSPNVRDISREKVCPGCRLSILNAFDEVVELGGVSWHAYCRQNRHQQGKTA
jgi:hypothetical protein